MKTLSSKFVLLFAGLALLLVFQEASAQFIGYEILNRNRRTTFSFEKVNNLIIIPVVLNDKLPLNFILDTGVRTTILTDKEISDLMNIPYDRSVTIAGAGHIRELNAYLASNISLSMPGLRGVGQSIIVLEEDYLELKSHLGKNVHGIIGYDFFNHFVVQIEYDRNTITVYDPEIFRPRRRFSPVPVTIEQGRPYISASLTQYDGTVINPKLLIDSGASHGLLLETDSDDEIITPEKRLKTIIGWGLGGELKGFLGRIRSISIDKYELKNVLVSFTDDYTDPEVTRVTGRNGSIGGEILSRFTVIFDYPGNMLYLRKNRSFRYPFEFNLAGIDLVASGTDYNTFRIINVIEGSPAYDAGIKNGDVILAVNWKLSTELTLNEINSILRSRPNKRMMMMIYRDGEIMRVTFRLKKLI